MARSQGRHIQIDDTIDKRLSGSLDVRIEDRAGRIIEARTVSNTVVRDAYAFMLDDASSKVGVGYINVFALGDDPTPTSWLDTALGNSLYLQLTTTQSRTDLRMVIYTEIDYDDANGNTYYEAGLFAVWSPTGGGGGTYRMFSRVAFRDEAGSIMGLQKDNEKKFFFTWTIGW